MASVKKVRKARERGTVVSLWLPAHIAEASDRLARRAGQSRSGYVRTLVEREVQREIADGRRSLPAAS